MIEELKQLLTMIQEVPEMVTHVLLGFAVYKVILFLGTSAGIYGTLRLAINKWHVYGMEKLSLQKLPKIYDIKGHFISEDLIPMFMVLLKDSKKYSTYIHSSDITRLTKAIEELEKAEAQEERDRQEKTNKLMADMKKDLSI